MLNALSYQSIGTGAVALSIALGLYVRVKSAPEGNETMARIARFVREGAMAFLAREYKVLAIYAAVVFALL
ncbi:MAG TPA: sodium/proton-translocating pyrophosphatase, partial [Labilithrix sp.]|nr:sodium/proton-translocating pyrophosphatase [Labilithrix sp.]